MAPKRGEKRQAQSVDKATVKTRKTEGRPGKAGSSDEDDARKKVERLLSDEIARWAYPEVPKGHGEVDWPDEKRVKKAPQPSSGKRETTGEGKKEAENDEGGKRKVDEGLRTYRSPDLTPFEQLLCAVLLSKPISHTLGLRSIRTVLSPPYSFGTPKALDEAGNEGRREALWEARTQHKEKTAEQLGSLVEGVRKLTETDDEDRAIQLAALLEHAKAANGHREAVDTVRDIITQNIKGVGPTGADIFLRQVQRHKGWECVFPFADHRALDVAARLGLLTDSKDEEAGAKRLASLVGQDRTKFVALLDILIGLDLEKKTDQVVKLLA